MEASNGPGGGAPIARTRVFDAIALGETASVTRTVAKNDVELFAAASGDYNPTHFDATFAKSHGFEGPVAHGMWVAAQLSDLLGNRLPGPGTIYVGQELRFLAPVIVGDTVTVTITVKEKRAATRTVLFDCSAVKQDGTAVLSGLAEVVAPDKVLEIPLIVPATVSVQHHDHYEQLIARCRREVEPIACVVVHPCERTALEGALDAAAAGIITPILVGPAARIRAVAAEAGLDLGELELVDTPHSHASAAKAVELIRAGRGELLMKGSLHSDELLGAVVAKDTGLRTERRISHVFIMSVPTYPEPLFITDAAVNIEPDLETKIHIVQNAIDLAIGLGVAEPRVAVLSAVENINPKIPTTLEAAALCKMAERGQITGALVDGPLAFDNAISPEAARIKGIVSPVAGRANILLVPDLESGNMLAKNLSFLSNADAAGIVLGARVPIILTSRADSVQTRMASAATAALYAQYLRVHGPRKMP
jgi:phosphotransacetylase/acyl dehydratase